MKLMKLAALGMAIAPMAACAQTQPVAPVEAVPREAVVYFTSDISPEGLVRVYKALGVEPDGKVAVKISTGNPDNSDSSETHNITVRFQSYSKFSLLGNHKTCSVETLY